MRRKFLNLVVLCLGLLLVRLISGGVINPVRPANADAPTFVVFLPLIAGTGSNCTTTQLIGDGGFEAGVPNPSWRVNSNKSSEIIDNSALPQSQPTHSGTWKAWLGGDNSVLENLWQPFTVPSSAASLQVSFWWQINTTEPTPLINDSLEIQITDANGGALQTLYTLYDGDANSTWVQWVKNISPTYAGQTLRIVFVAKTDASNPTSFFIDDVSVQSCR